MSDSPTVTIGLPVYNGEKYLRSALCSLEAQSFENFEVVLCDNASTDGTEAICREFAEKDKRFRYYRNPENLGAAKNFNRAFELGRGRYFRWMGHDDQLHVDYLERCVHELDAAPTRISLVFTGVRYIDSDGKELSEERGRKIRGVEKGESLAGLSFARLLRLPPSAAPIFVFGLIRTSVLQKTRLIGGYIASDLVINAELRLLGEFLELPEALFDQRIHHREVQRVKRSTLRGEAEWFDPKAGAPLLLPGVRLVWEFLRGIHRLPLGGAGRAHADFAVLGFAVARTQQFLHEVLFRIWSRVSVWSVRHHQKWSAVLRLWVFLKGVTSGNRGLVSLATRSSSERAVLGRLLFGSLRVGKRAEINAEQLLIEWLEAGDENEQLAAALAIQGNLDRYQTAYHSLYGEAGKNDLDELLAEVGRRNEPRKERVQALLFTLNESPDLLERW